jgi:linker histone H1 and H5 family
MSIFYTLCAPDIADDTTVWARTPARQFTFGGSFPPAPAAREKQRSRKQQQPTMTTLQLIKEAIGALKDRTGSSVIAINKYIETEKKVSCAVVLAKQWRSSFPFFSFFRRSTGVVTTHCRLSIGSSWHTKNFLCEALNLQSDFSRCRMEGIFPFFVSFWENNGRAKWPLAGRCCRNENQCRSQPQIIDHRKNTLTLASDW